MLLSAWKLLVHLKHWQMGEGVLERVADLAAGWDLGLVTFEGGGLFSGLFLRCALRRLGGGDGEVG